jgi:hypothetical protein
VCQRLARLARTLALHRLTAGLLAGCGDATDEAADTNRSYVIKYPRVTAPLVLTKAWVAIPGIRVAQYECTAGG